MPRPKKNTDLPDFCEAWKGLIRVRVQVPVSLIPIIGQRNLYRSTGLPVGTRRATVQRVAQPIIDEFHDRIAAARPSPKESLVWVDRLQPRTMTIPDLPDLALSPETIRQIRKLILAEHADAEVVERGAAGTGMRIEVPASVAARMQTAEPAGKVYDYLDGIAAWAVEQKIDSKGQGDARSKFKLLFARLGHSDMNRVRDTDIVDHKAALLKSERGHKTVENHLKIIKPVFGIAKGNKKIDQNPCEGITFTAKPDPRTKRRDFSEDDRAAIYRYACIASDPVIKWANIVALFSGLRLAEIAEADTRDVVLVDGIWCLRIQYDHRDGERRIKNPESVRDIPLHPEVIRLGFLDYVRGLPAGALFPTLKADKAGRLNDDASDIIGKWLRDVVGITDPRKVFHSHRHTVETLFSDLGVRRDIAFCITGHSLETEGDGYIHHKVKTLYTKGIKKIPVPKVEADARMAA